VPDDSPLRTWRTRPDDVVPSVTSIPPSETLPPFKLISADDDELVRLDRRTSTRSESSVIVPPVVLSKGPARETDAGATSSDAGKPVVVSATLKKLPPDCESRPMTLEFTS